MLGLSFVLAHLPLDAAVGAVAGGLLAAVVARFPIIGYGLAIVALTAIAIIWRPGNGAELKALLDAAVTYGEDHAPAILGLLAGGMLYSMYNLAWTMGYRAGLNAAA